MSIRSSSDEVTKVGKSAVWKIAYLSCKPDLVLDSSAGLARGDFQLNTVTYQAHFRFLQTQQMT